MLNLFLKYRLKLSIANSILVAWLFNIFGFIFGIPLIQIDGASVPPAHYFISYLCELIFILFTFDAIKFSIKATNKNRPKFFLSTMIVINSIISLLYCGHIIELIIWNL